MPFVSLLVVFLGVVGMIHDQHMFDPIIAGVLDLEDKAQIGVLYIVNGLLSAVSDNVFVATVFAEQLEKAFIYPNGTFVESRGGKQQYDRLGAAVIAGTNLPSMFTPNGQAALLFILTSSIAPLIHLSYRKMMVMTLPYVIVCSSLGLLACLYWQWGM
jgi:NhaB family Na+:H+ antiporter